MPRSKSASCLPVSKKGRRSSKSLVRRRPAVCPAHQVRKYPFGAIRFFGRVFGLAQEDLPARRRVPGADYVIRSADRGARDCGLRAAAPCSRPECRFFQSGIPLNEGHAHQLRPGFDRNSKFGGRRVLAANRDQFDPFAVDCDFKLMRFTRPSRQFDVDDVVGVDREVAFDSQSTACAERQRFNAVRSVPIQDESCGC